MAESSTTPVDPRKTIQHAVDLITRALPPRLAKSLGEELSAFVNNWDALRGVHSTGMFAGLVDYHEGIAREVIELAEGSLRSRASGTPAKAGEARP